MIPRIVISIILICTITACTAAGEGSLQSPISEEAESSTQKAWPAPPGIARISYLYTFHNLEDLGYRESFSRAFKNFLGGNRFQGMVRPYAIAVDDNILAIADPGLSAVHLFLIARKRYKVLASAGRRSFSSPVGLALGEDRLFVADSVIKRVFVFDGKQRLLGEVTGLERPTGLAYDRARERLYVADTLAHKILEYDRDGQLQREFGGRGTTDGKFNYPTHLFVSDSRLYVNDTMNFRIQIFDLVSGNHIRSLGEHGDKAGYFAQPKGIAVMPDGSILVAEPVLGQIQAFNHDGEFLLAFGSQGESPGQFMLPAGLAFWDNLIYVADAGNRRVQVFQYENRD